MVAVPPDFPSESESIAETFEIKRDVYTVSRLNREVKWLLTDNFPRLWIEGEVSNLARPASGHWYFTLKDGEAQVRCAMFRQHNRRLNFIPANGNHVLVRAQVSLFEPRGDFQLVVESMEEAGDGALRRAFEALKQRLHGEGLFAPEHKRSLPPWPERLGVITSPSGAAVRDVLTVLRRRFSGLEVILYPCQVQGESAKYEIARALETANRRHECDVLLLVRGGGSLEDLWAFNEEMVARAIHASRIPVVAGVGHEIDFTIADFAADHRAPTPSAAAETVSPDSEALHRHLVALENRISLWFQRHRRQLGQQLRWLTTRLRQTHPARRLTEKMQRLDEVTLRCQRALQSQLASRRQRLETRLARLARHHPADRLIRTRIQVEYLDRRLHEAQGRRLDRHKQYLGELSRALDTVSPLATLGRGYAIATDAETGHVLTEARQMQAGDHIRARLAQGQLLCEVKEVIEDE
ncbi:exodeoxyribonuclease VII large subunit [Methylohalobius crimeensis]|uniref:exodeoxyribonuclease VII large subunit n=1 Tax=Methylohalobius crimeensis TaxID=244365 RepID=UPI0003B527D1|nr:exodeoxyribonuclease VII large subunit [Methylohalobius crimeensis]